MAGQLFVHLGPAKTATTSLQLAFEALLHPAYIYAGVLQPRERNAGSVSQRLHNAICGDIAPDERDGLKSDVKQLANFVDGGGIALLSEEILSLNLPDSTFQAKIDQLANLLNGIPTTIILTLRDPVAALPSFYQEIFVSLPPQLKINFARFCNDMRTLSFDYPEMQKLVVKAGLPGVRWLDFARIEANELTTRDVFGNFDLWQDQLLTIGTANRGARSLDGHARILPPLNLGDIAGYVQLNKVASRMRLSNSPISRWAMAQLNATNIYRPRPRDLIVPQTRASELLAGYETIRQDLTGNQRDES